MAENNKKIEEAQKKLVCYFVKYIIDSLDLMID
jgi:hypothetical protein